MPFRGILHELVHSTDGAVGAIFLDQEGETVELVSADGLAPDDLRVIGAYQGIFLSQLKRLCTAIDAGAPRRFKVEYEKMNVLSCDLKDGYYVSLLVKPQTNEGLAWHRLSVCRESLLAEM